MCAYEPTSWLREIIFRRYPRSYLIGEDGPASGPHPVLRSRIARTLAERRCEEGVYIRCDRSRILVSIGFSSPEISDPFPELDSSAAARWEMFPSRPAVHPVEAPPLADEAENPLDVRMKDVQGMPGTPGGLALRLVQFAFAVAALGVMTSTSDFPAVTAFW
ncbi:hypothetical protein B296_00032876 [Ensete ventricosum]|uniref:CASP-like protein n=1 Tax=Ensete ventricosum TaxID=4639 RepID=A0A426YS54_ENSVE|nr:hypothetical protein B296_00032876 [Ensete ventricosum]